MNSIYNPFSLAGKTILITGASSGIGRTTAIECSRLGANVCLTGRNQSRLEETLSLMQEGNHTIIVADLTNENDIERLAIECPVFNGVVNNAGVATTKPLSFYSKKDLDKVYNANTFAPMLLIRLLLKKKKITDMASLVFISSVAAFSSHLGNGIYGSSKAALTAYTKYCAKELSIKGIRANAIHPGMIETSFIHGGAVSEEEIIADIAKYPLGRYGKPEEIAWAVIYLLSDASAWVTGTSMIVDGGVML